MPRFFSLLTLLLIVSLVAGTSRVALGLEPTDKPSTAAASDGLRVYSIGHSFHVFMPNIVTDIAKGAQIKNHSQVGMSAIGGSRVIQHWDVPEDRFKSKELLSAGKVDVLTIAPIFLPDDGIEKFVTLAFQHNPKVRVTLQENWLPYEVYTPPALQRQDKVDHDALTVDELRKRHAPYFESLEGHAKQLNEKLGQPVIAIVPVGQAIIALREKILAGQTPGLTKQSELFTDPIGHATPPLQALVAYVHYSVIYRQSPVGLPVPAIMNRTPQNAELAKLLQELAWQAVTEHPMSGVKQQ